MNGELRSLRRRESSWFDKSARHSGSWLVVKKESKRIRSFDGATTVAIVSLRLFFKGRSRVRVVGYFRTVVKSRRNGCQKSLIIGEAARMVDIPGVWVPSSPLQAGVPPVIISRLLMSWICGVG